MAHHSQLWLLLCVILLCAVTSQSSQPLTIDGEKSAVFLSPSFVLGPGSVENKYYYNIDFPRGHIALKGFDAEVVDELGNPIPLHDTYLHHWAVMRYYGRARTGTTDNESESELHTSNFIEVRNSGICGTTLGQYFGLGSETRHTETHVPGPYRIEVGNPEEIPDGYEERWLLNVHAIDTRGAEDRLGCTECRCDLYNVTVDEYGGPLKEGYTGGLYCCYDQTQCRVRQGFQGVHRRLYLRYTVKWVDWDDSAVIPVRIYIFDVTDSGKRSTNPFKSDANLGCKVEYEVNSCHAPSRDNADCTDSKKTRLAIPRGGDIIYGVAHQHTGGIGSALYGEDGQELCKSIPVYGEGEEAGNEKGYIVGMSTCYPNPGSVRINDGEVLTLESNYTSSQMHTGVMGLFYILVANPLPESTIFALSSVHDHISSSIYVYGLVILGVVMAVAVILGFRRGNGEQGYQTIVM
ncbi:hypothetical protein QJS10_CPA16g00786 [Acorus calamus]|uniref:MtN19-like protein n=1 Tax=Acorus calamus TaxID=4465 RepID=A0AAV9D1L4_ACOCL|nr:hypothetical protein QJS10_CPA16g00786 [Acorus calamus]